MEEPVESIADEITEEAAGDVTSPVSGVSEALTAGASLLSTATHWRARRVRRAEGRHQGRTHGVHPRAAGGGQRAVESSGDQAPGHQTGEHVSDWLPEAAVSACRSTTSVTAYQEAVVSAYRTPTPEAWSRAAG